MDKEVVDLYLDDIIPNRFQPREVFNEEALQELATSIKEHGIIQPIIVRKVGDKYEIIAGERRYKASVIAGLTKIPAIIRNLDDKEASKIALLENLQRKDLTAIEEARTYQKILEIDSMTQEELGRTLGKSQAAIANKMRLLSLPDEIQEALLQDQISERHARSLLNLDTSAEQIDMLKKIINNRLTVRELDNEISFIKGDIPNIDNTVVSENGPKIEVTSNNDNNVLFPKDSISKIIEELDDNEYDILESPSEILENLDEEEKQEEELKKIDQLLKKTSSYTLKDVVSEIKAAIEKIRNKGFDIRLDEMDFENTYQVIINIEKDK